jgi:hypothetical protein
VTTTPTATIMNEKCVDHHDASSCGTNSVDEDQGNVCMEESSTMSHTHGTGGGTSTNRSSTYEEVNATTIKAKLSRNETQKISRLRFVFIGINLTVAGIVAFVIHRTAEHAEQQSFDQQYNATVDKLTESFSSIGQRVGSISSVGHAATIYGFDQSSTFSSRWPFITVTHFQQRSATARLLSGSLYMSIPPIVLEEDRKEWETYIMGSDRNWM